MGRWPWPRENHVELLRRLKAANVRAVAVDILFAEAYSDYPEVDRMLAAAIQGLGKVVLPVFLAQATIGGRLWEIPPVDPIRESAAQIGHVHIEVASDGVAREVFLYEGLGRPRWPHFSLALARVLGEAPADIPGVSDLQQGGEEHPGLILRSHVNLVRFMGPAGTVPRVSYVDVMKGRVGEEVLADKVVFVGATAAGHADNITTSLGQIPGVEVNANIFEALRSGRFATPLEQRTVALVSFALVVITIPLFLSFQPRPLLALLGFSVLLVPLVSLFIFQRWGLWFSPVPIVVTFLLTYPLWSWLRLATAVDFIHEQLAQLEFANRNLSYLHKDDPKLERGGDPVEDVLRQLDRAHSESRYNHELVRQTLEEMASGVILAEVNGRVLLANHEAMELLEFAGASGAGSDVRLLLESLEPPPSVSISRSLDDLHSVGDSFSFECDLKPDGRNLLLQGSIIGLDRLLLVFVLTDITALKDSERKRAEALNFLSHDLRAPLTSVLALLEGARDEGAQEVDAELLTQVESYVRKNLSYAEDFLHLARMEHEAADSYDYCDSASLVDNAVAQVFHSAARRGIEIRIEYSDSSEWIHCKRHDIERALTNLIDNALKHSKAGDEVVVRVEQDAGFATFVIRDEGEGIQEGDASRLFAAFQQGKNAIQGVGLGLRFVSVVAANHGGTLEVENNADRGSSFHLRIALDSRES